MSLLDALVPETAVKQEAPVVKPSRPKVPREKAPQREHGAYRRTDPDTSEAAAMSVDANRLEQILLDAIKKHGKDGLTLREAQEEIEINLDWGTISPRAAPLRRKGYIFDSGIRRPSKTSKRSGIAWIAKEFHEEHNDR